MDYCNEIEIEGKYLSTIDNYLDFLFPHLSAKERIAVFLKQANRPRTVFLESTEELKLSLHGVFRSCDSYISLSTCVAVDGDLNKSAKNMYKRYVMGFDFDKKDFKGKMKTVQEFTAYFKNTTGLFIHFVVDSGNGYHIYIGIEETDNIARVTNLTRRYAALSGADLANISQAQSLRLPNTLNYKDRNKPLAVNIVSGYTNDRKFRRYSLDFLEGNLIKLETAAGIPKSRKKSYKPIVHRAFKGMLPCVSNILLNGVPKGERNKCLGRLVGYFRDVANIDPQTALQEILEWNDRCSSLCNNTEKKSENEVKKDFYRYWKNENYYLLGCVSDTNPMSNILEKYCDKTVCPKYRTKPVLDTTKFFILDKRYVTDKCLARLKGYAYVILKILIGIQRECKLSDLVRVTGFSEQTVSRTLSALLEMQLINVRIEQRIRMYRSKNFAVPKEKHYITLPNKLFDLLMSSDISEQELMLYIAIRRNAYFGKKCTQEILGRLLGLTERSISRISKQMVANGLIIVEARKTGEIIKKGEKTIEKTFNYYHFPLENEYAGSSSL